MANSSKTPVKTPLHHSSLISEGILVQTSLSRRSDSFCSDGSPKYSSMRKHCSSSSLHPEGQTRVTQLTVPRSRRSQPLPETDAVLRLVHALARTGVPLCEAQFFESLIQHQSGARKPLPSTVQLHQNFLPALARQHDLVLHHFLQHREVFVFLHEATTDDGRAVLGISLLPLDRVGQPPILIGVEFLEQFSHILVTRAVARVLNGGNILFQHVLAVVTGGGFHMIQAFDANGIFGIVLHTALHIPCLLHQLELVMELWPNRLEKLATMLHLLEDTFGWHAALRHKYEFFLKKRELKLSLPLLNSQTGPEAWLEKAIGIKEHLLVLGEFLAVHKEEGALLTKLQNLLAESNADLMAEATFVAEHATGLLKMAQFLHRSSEPLAHRIYGELDSLRTAFSFHLDTNLGPDTRRCLSLSPGQVQLTEQFHNLLSLCLTHLQNLINSHPAMPTLKAVRALDPKQLGAVGRSREEHVEGLPELSKVSDLEWFRYQHLAEAAPVDVSLPKWWKAQTEQLLTLSPLACRYLWLPVCSSKSPFPPGGILNLTRTEEGFTENSARFLCMLRHNRSLP